MLFSFVVFHHLILNSLAVTAILKLRLYIWYFFMTVVMSMSIVITVVMMMMVTIVMMSITMASIAMSIPTIPRASFRCSRSFPMVMVMSIMMRVNMVGIRMMRVIMMSIMADRFMVKQWAEKANHPGAPHLSNIFPVKISEPQAEPPPLGYQAQADNRKHLGARTITNHCSYLLFTSCKRARARFIAITRVYNSCTCIYTPIWMKIPKCSSLYGRCSSLYGQSENKAISASN